MNRNQPDYAQAVYRDKSIDPGSAPHALTRHSALRNLDAAVAANELPDLPTNLATILSARGKIDAFATTMFGTQLTGMAHTTQLADSLVLAAFTGEALPDGETFTQRMREAWTADQASAVQSQIVQHAVRETEGRTSAGISQHLEDYLAVVRAAVMAVVAKVRDLDAILDGLNITDVSAVAKASAKQRDAVGALPDLARQYNRLRMLQRDLLVASEDQAPGVNDTSVERDSRAWASVFDAGLMEFERVNYVDHGVPHDLPASERILAVARRTDVWVPTPDEADEAWQALSTPAVA